MSCQKWQSILLFYCLVDWFAKKIQRFLTNLMLMSNMTIIDHPWVMGSCLRPCPCPCIWLARTWTNGGNIFMFGLALVLMPPWVERVSCESGTRPGIKVLFQTRSSLLLLSTWDLLCWREIKHRNRSTSIRFILSRWSSYYICFL